MSDPRYDVRRVSKDAIVVETPSWRVVIVENDSVMAAKKGAEK